MAITRDDGVGVHGSGTRQHGVIVRIGCNRLGERRRVYDDAERGEATNEFVDRLSCLADACGELGAMQDVVKFTQEISRCIEVDTFGTGKIEERTRRTMPE